MNNDVTNESNMLLNRFNTYGNVSIKRIIFDELLFKIILQIMVK